MGSGIALDHAAIMSTVLEGILYGVFSFTCSIRWPLSRFAGFSLLMFIGTIWVLTRPQDRRASSPTMILIAVILLVLSTAVSLLVK